jgi:hypothetical protein
MIDVFNVEQDLMAARSSHLERPSRLEAGDWNGSQRSISSLYVDASAHQPEDPLARVSVVR